MKLLLIAASAMSVLCAPAWAVNKCTAPDGRPVFQDKLCPEQGETVGQEIARREKERKALQAQQEQQARISAALQAKSAHENARVVPEDASQSTGGYAGYRRYSSTSRRRR